jgi:hypothetical protein
MAEPEDQGDTSGNNLFLGRQPILDRSEQLLAYELLFRSGQKNAASLADHEQVQATATVVTNAFSQLAVGDALGPYRGFINVDRDFLFSDMIELLPRDAVMLEILETVIPDEAVVARCRPWSMWSRSICNRCRRIRFVSSPLASDPPGHNCWPKKSRRGSRWNSAATLASNCFRATTSPNRPSSPARSSTTRNWR